MARIVKQKSGDGSKHERKTLWRDIGDLRKPNSAWRIGRAAQWFEERLGLPRGVLAFRNPDGTKARTDKTLKALKRDWERKGVRR